jgi:hypothetical protein
MNIKSCPSGGCREIWPVPVVSSANTALPAPRRRTSPSLVSNSTSPVSQITSLRWRGLCQATSRMPSGTRQNLQPDDANVSDRRSGRLSSKTCLAVRRIPLLAYGSRHLRPRRSAGRRHARRLPGWPRKRHPASMLSHRIAVSGSKAMIVGCEVCARTLLRERSLGDGTMAKSIVVSCRWCQIQP